MAAWLLWSGLYKPLLIGLGILSCLLTLALARRMDAFSDHVFGLRLHPRALSPSLPISPTVVEIDALPKGRFGQAILGNSITLTPGSLTIDDHEGKLLVHCLTEAGARELESGEMNRRAAALTED
jgi:multicomponent Na+:H+ antiporter subunit E